MSGGAAAVISAAGGPRQPIKWWAKLVYAGPAFALAAAAIFHVSWQTKYYVDDLGLGPRLFALSNAIVCLRGERRARGGRRAGPPRAPGPPPALRPPLCAQVRSVGLFGYPFFGWLSDNLYVDSSSPAARGRRRPLLLASAPLVALSLFLLYAAPALPPSALQAWFCVTAIIYNAVPLTLTYYALGTEVTSDYDEQVRGIAFHHARVLTRRALPPKSSPSLHLSLSLTHTRPHAGVRLRLRARAGVAGHDCGLAAARLHCVAAHDAAHGAVSALCAGHCGGHCHPVGAARLADACARLAHARAPRRRP